MKTLLSTVAMTALLGTAALAEEHASAANDNMTYSLEQGDFYASNLLGSRIYASERDPSEIAAFDPMDEWNDIGEINDFIVGPEGEVQAVIVGVGGFLGLGEKDVAVPMTALSTLDDDDGNRFLVISASQAELEAMPTFDYEPLDFDIAEMSAGEHISNEMAEAETEMETMEAEAEAELAEADAEMETIEAEAEAEMADAEAEVETMAAEAETEMAEAETEMVETSEEVADAAAEERVLEPGVAPEGFAMVNVNEVSADELTGAEVVASGDEWVGEVSELLIDDNGQVTQAVIDVGGFLGIGEKPVALSFEQLDIMREEGSGMLQVAVNMSREELDAMEAYAAE